jgi:hypothetical protein
MHNLAVLYEGKVDAISAGDCITENRCAPDGGKQKN